MKDGGDDSELAVEPRIISPVKDCYSYEGSDKSISLSMMDDLEVL